MLNDGNKSSSAYEAFNTLFLVAIILSMFGAVTGTLGSPLTYPKGAYLFLGSDTVYEVVQVCTFIPIRLSLFSPPLFSIVPKQSVKLLAHRRSYDQGQVDEDLPHPTHCETISELLIAFALNSCLWLTGA